MEVNKTSTFTTMSSSSSHNKQPSFPCRVFLKGYPGGRLSSEATAVQQVMTARGVPCHIYTTEDFLTLTTGGERGLTKYDLVVGDFTWTRHALSVLGITMPSNIDYPKCLEYLLYRRVWKSTLSEVQCQLLIQQSTGDAGETEGTGIFIKPYEDCKAFSGLVANAGWMEYLLHQFSETMPVYCSELIKMVAEYRVYVLHGKILGVCHYQGPKPEEDSNAVLDSHTVRQAVDTLFADPVEGKDLSGCAMDFAVMRLSDGRYVTGLVEVNEGFSIGIYEGISFESYTEMLIGRWQKLMGL